MDGTLIFLRILHVVCGAFWVGAVFATVLFIARAVADAGPAGGQVMAALIKRRYFDWLPIIALVSVLSGVDLLRRVSDGFRPEYMGSRGGIVLSIGALAGVLALVIGAVVSRPSTLGAAALMAKAAPLPDGAEKAALVAQATARRARGMLSLRIITGLLLVAITCMAAWRYA